MSERLNQTEKIPNKEKLASAGFLYAKGLYYFRRSGGFDLEQKDTSEFRNAQTMLDEALEFLREEGIEFESTKIKPKPIADLFEVLPEDVVKKIRERDTGNFLR